MRSLAMGARAVLACAAITLAVSAAPASAATFEVTKKSDLAPGGCGASDCSLREAIRAANSRPGADVVVLPSRRGAYKLSQPNTDEDEALDGDLDVTTDPLVIRHPGKGRATVDADGLSRVFDVHDGARTTFKRIVVRDGDNEQMDQEGGGIRSLSNIVLVRSSVTSNDSVYYGGGIGLRSESGAGLTMKRSSVSGNTSENDGGGIDGDTGPLIMVRSKLTNNESASTGGGCYCYPEGESRIDASTISGNVAGASGGGLRMSADELDLTITDTTISGNQSAAAGGGMVTGSGTIRITNSTVAGNRAGGSGGGIDVPTGTLRLNATTVARNLADIDGDGGAGGGINRSTTEGLVSVENSLIALNQADGARDDCAGEPFNSLGHNLLSVASMECEGFDATGDMIRSNPKIGQLARNGGPTKTVALKAGSAAIDEAKRSSAPGRDQRGVRRDNKPDIGAFER
jgi:trimeric autotransporter adhesin